jgi:hypothetical protein
MHTEHLTNQRIMGMIPYVFMAAVLSNKGRHGNKSVITTSAVLYHSTLMWNEATPSGF